MSVQNNEDRIRKTHRFYQILGLPKDPWVILSRVCSDLTINDCHPKGDYIWPTGFTPVFQATIFPGVSIVTNKKDCSVLGIILQNSALPKTISSLYSYIGIIIRLFELIFTLGQKIGIFKQFDY